MEEIIQLGKRRDLMKAIDKLDKTSAEELCRIKFLVLLKWYVIERICKCLEIAILFLTVFLATYSILTLIGL